MLAFVWAEDENRLIGDGDVLPWRLPADVKFFKDVTMRYARLAVGAAVTVVYFLWETYEERKTDF